MGSHGLQPEVEFSALPPMLSRRRSTTSHQVPSSKILKVRQTFKTHKNISRYFKRRHLIIHNYIWTLAIFWPRFLACSNNFSFPWFLKNINVPDNCTSAMSKILLIGTTFEYNLKGNCTLAKYTLLSYERPFKILKNDMCTNAIAKPFLSYDGLKMNKRILRLVGKGRFQTFRASQ